MSVHGERPTSADGAGVPESADVTPAPADAATSVRARAGDRPASLVEVLRIVRRNATVLAATVLAALIAGAIVTATATESYETETKVLVTPVLAAADAGATGGSSDLIGQAASLVRERAATFAALVETPTVLDPAIESSGVDVASTELVDDVTATLVPETSIVEITVSAGSATDAAELANGIAASLVTQIEAQNLPASPVGLTGEQVQAPEIPSSPAWPSWPINLLVALGIGLVVAFLVIVVRQSLSAGRPLR